jgi:hypothetical protein
VDVGRSDISNGLVSEEAVIGGGGCWNWNNGFKAAVIDSNPSFW